MNKAVSSERFIPLEVLNRKGDYFCLIYPIKSRFSFSLSGCRRVNGHVKAAREVRVRDEQRRSDGLISQ